MKTNRSLRTGIFLLFAVAAVVLLFRLNSSLPHPRDLKDSRSSKWKPSHSSSNAAGGSNDDASPHTVNSIKELDDEPGAALEKSFFVASGKGTFLDAVRKQLKSQPAAKQKTHFSALCWRIQLTAPAANAGDDKHSQERRQQQQFLRRNTACEQDVEKEMTKTAEAVEFTPWPRFAAEFLTSSEHSKPRKETLLFPRQGGGKKFGGGGGGGGAKMSLDLDRLTAHARSMKELAEKSVSAGSLVLTAAGDNDKDKDKSTTTMSYDAAIRSAIASRIENPLRRSALEALAELDERTAKQSLELLRQQQEGEPGHAAPSPSSSWLFFVAVHVDGHAPSVVRALDSVQAQFRSLLVSSTRFSLQQQQQQQQHEQVQQRVAMISFIIPRLVGRDTVIEAIRRIFSDAPHCQLGIQTSSGMESQMTATVTCIATAAAASNNNKHGGNHLQSPSHDAALDYYSARSPWCDDVIIDFDGALKFGSKTGVYIGGVLPLQQQPLFDEHEDRQLIKHYNFLQYANGFLGLHAFLVKPVFHHPVIVLPTEACVFGGSTTAAESALLYNSVFQFQPLIPQQLSLSKMLKIMRKNHRALTWPDRLDLTVQLLCAFSFLHAHPRGPFSFDDNHPDQYLVVFPSAAEMENVVGPSSELSSRMQNRHNLRLKMVDIDTLQKAVPVMSSSSGGRRQQQQQAEEQNTDTGRNRILPPGAKLGQAAWNSSLRFGRYQQSRGGGVIAMPSLENFVLRCRCFYCRGRSNCMFVNSYEGYHSCGQASSDAAGDDGNAEPRTEEHRQRLQLRRCSLLTDSWYLGQLLYFLLRGELLFPASSMSSMHSVVEGINSAVERSVKLGATATVEELFTAGASGAAQSKKRRNDPPVLAAHPEDEQTFGRIIRALLIERISPEAALKQLRPLLASYSMDADPFTEVCPADFGSQSFRGLRIKT